MYEVVRRYKGQIALFIALAEREQDVRKEIQAVPGLVGYYLVRSADGGATITICQDQAGTTQSTKIAAEWMRQNYPDAAGTPPEVTEGEVLFNFGQ